MKEHDQRDGEDGPDVVNARREEIVEVNDAAAREREQRNRFETGSGGIENVVQRDTLDHERDEAFGQRDECHQHDADASAETRTAGRSSEVFSVVVKTTMPRFRLP